MFKNTMSELENKCIDAIVARMDQFSQFSRNPICSGNSFMVTSHHISRESQKKEKAAQPDVKSNYLFFRNNSSLVLLLGLY